MFLFSFGRLPTNRECRHASIMCVIAFVGFCWGFIAGPRHSSAYWSGWLLATVLFVLSFATLVRAQPLQGLMWPNLRPLRADLPTLDERDHYVRYRAFSISYQILYAAVVLLLVIKGLVGPASVEIIPQRFWKHGALLSEILFMLVFLFTLLPYWVLPWLDSASPRDADNDASARSAAPVAYAPRKDFTQTRLWLFWTMMILLVVAA